VLILSKTSATPVSGISSPFLDRSHIDVTEWEARFIEDTYDRTAFTFKQRQSIDKMIERYGEEIGF